MKYNAYLQDANYNLINQFWFRSQFGINEMDKVLEIAKSIADSNGYSYQNISVGKKS